jgi:hypothetical protein
MNDITTLSLKVKLVFTLIVTLPVDGKSSLTLASGRIVKVLTLYTPLFRVIVDLLPTMIALKLPGLTVWLPLSTMLTFVVPTVIVFVGIVYWVIVVF